MIERFYANYHSIRFVGDTLVVRMRLGPSRTQLDELNTQFGHLASQGRITTAEPFKVERRDDDHVDLDRISFKFTNQGYSELVSLIGVINSYVS